MADVLIADVRQASASFSLLALCEQWLMAKNVGCLIF